MVFVREKKLFYTSLESPIGNLFAALTVKGVCFLCIDRSEVKFLHELKDSGIIDIRRDDLKGGFIKRELEEYFAGELRHFQTPIDLLWGTPFERRVWRELSHIPYGKIRSYREVAKFVGVPRGYRAVGRAVGKNPIGIIIPCHRVILSDGGLGGFGAGVEAKRYLLKLEGHSISP